MMCWAKRRDDEEEVLVQNRSALIFELISDSETVEINGQTVQLHTYEMSPTAQLCEMC